MGTDYLSGVGEFLKLLAMDSNPIQEGRGGEGIYNNNLYLLPLAIRITVILQ